MKTICVYHSRDLDGWVSAAIVKKMEQEKFTIQFKKDHFSKNELKDMIESTKLKVLSEPKRKHGNIFSRLINWITFGKYCKESYSYNVKIV